MGMFHAAYVAYGVQVDVDPYGHDRPTDQIDDALSVPTVKEACPDVDHLLAGGYDDDKVFIVTAHQEAGYEPTRFYPSHGEAEAYWGGQIVHFLEVMGWSELVAKEPSWFVIADTS